MTQTTNFENLYGCEFSAMSRRTAEDNSVPAYRGAEEDEEEEQDPANEDNGEIPS
jgi:hypothetical protein